MYQIWHSGNLTQTKCSCCDEALWISGRFRQKFSYIKNLNHRVLHVHSLLWPFSSRLSIALYIIAVLLAQDLSLRPSICDTCHRLILKQIIIRFTKIAVDPSPLPFIRRQRLVFCKKIAGIGTIWLQNVIWLEIRGYYLGEGCYSTKR